MSAHAKQHILTWSREFQGFHAVVLQPCEPCYVFLPARPYATVSFLVLLPWRRRSGLCSFDAEHAASRDARRRVIRHAPWNADRSAHSCSHIGPGLRTRGLLNLFLASVFQMAWSEGLAPSSVTVVLQAFKAYYTWETASTLTMRQGESPPTHHTCGARKLGFTPIALVFSLLMHSSALSSTRATAVSTVLLLVFLVFVPCSKLNGQRPKARIRAWPPRCPAALPLPTRPPSWPMRRREPIRKPRPPRSAGPPSC